MPDQVPARGIPTSRMRILLVGMARGGERAEQDRGVRDRTEGGVLQPQVRGLMQARTAGGAQ